MLLPKKFCICVAYFSPGGESVFEFIGEIQTENEAYIYKDIYTTYDNIHHLPVVHH